MNRWTGVGNLAQAALYAALVAEAAGRWMPMAWVLGAAAGAQLFGGGWLLAGRGARPARLASGLSLAVVALLVGLHLQVLVHVIRHFHPVGATQAWQVFGALLLVLPLVAGFPLWQWLRGRPGPAEARGVGGAAVLALALPPAVAAGLGAEAWPALDGADLAARAWAGQALPAEGPPVMLAGLRRGRVVAHGGGPTPRAAADALEAPDDLEGLVLEVAAAEGPLWSPWLSRGGWLVRPGETGLRGGAGWVGSVPTWRSTAVGRAEATPSLFLPALQPERAPDATHWVRTRAWLASDAGVVPLQAGWSTPPALSAATARDAAIHGATHVAENMGAGGRFAYVVKAPSGRHGRGYNFPRHAGGTWYLARAAARTGDPGLRARAEEALGFLARHTREVDGRAYVLDPDRDDGRVWIGTTALALLAGVALEADPALLRRWAAFVASAVDDRGVIRGEMELATGAWPDQPWVTYAHGQGLLALAVAARAGVPGVDAALDRAAAFVDGPYWPMPASRMFMLDEHWTCLAMLAVHDVRGHAAGEQVCTAYLLAAPQTPPATGYPVPPAAGPGGGRAEAVVARAELDRRRGEIASPWRDRALAWGRRFLAAQYRAADAPLLARPERLVGGFRDRPWEPDVRVDAVQHIGCALLGVEQLLRGEPTPGGMP